MHKSWQGLLHVPYSDSSSGSQATRAKLSFQCKYMLPTGARKSNYCGIQDEVYQYKILEVFQISEYTFNKGINSLVNNPIVNIEISKWQIC